MKELMNERRRFDEEGAYQTFSYATRLSSVSCTADSFSFVLHRDEINSFSFVLHMDEIEIDAVVGRKLKIKRGALLGSFVPHAGLFSLRSPSCLAQAHRCLSSLQSHRGTAS
jgi:hypothetical protein